MSVDAAHGATTARPQWGLAGTLLVGVAVSAALAAYARVHPGDGRGIFTLWFSGMLPMKSWLATGAVILLVVQLVTALWMWGRLPIRAQVPAWAATVHRWSGATAFILTLPVVFHCVWSLGFATDSTRALVHSVAGCVVYGAFAAKMLALRMRALPGWTLPVVGGLVLASLVVAWFSSALWYFTRSGAPLF